MRDTHSPSTEDDGRTRKRRKIHRNQEILEIKFSKESNGNERSIKELRRENANLGDDLARMTYKRAESELKLKTAEKELDRQRIELEEARVEIEKLKSQRTSCLKENRELRSKAKRVDRLEKELESLRTSNEHQETISTQEILEIAEGLGQKLASLRGKYTELKLKVEEYESIKPGVTPAALKDEYHHLVQVNADIKAQLDVLRRERDELRKIHVKGGKRTTNKDRNAGTSSSARHQSTSDSNDDRDNDVDSPIDIEQEKRNLRVRFEGYYALVSDAKYFEIDWEKYYKHNHSFGYSCNKCRKEFISLCYMKDHIWCEHYGGSFKCFYCKDSSQEFTCRVRFKNHMKRKHLNVY